MAFSGQSEGFQIFLGHFKTEASGTLNCVDGIGGTYSQDITVTMQTCALSATIGAGSFKIAGLSTEISLLDQSPEVLFGHYLVAQGQASIFAGAGAFTAVRVAPPQVALNVSVQLLTGFGLELGVQKMTIAPATPAPAGM
jgi:hypothetical protein